MAMRSHGPALLPPKSMYITYLLWLFLGVFGVHQFYMGKMGRGILYLLTGGVFGIMVIVDLFTIPGQLRNVNAQRAVGIS